MSVDCCDILLQNTKTDQSYNKCITNNIYSLKNIFYRVTEL